MIPPEMPPRTSSSTGSTAVLVRFERLVEPYRMKSAVTQSRKPTTAPLFTAWPVVMGRPVVPIITVMSAAYAQDPTNTAQRSSGLRVAPVAEPRFAA